MRSVQNVIYSFSLLLPFSLKTYHFSLEVVKFYTWAKGRTRIRSWTFPGIMDLVRNVTITADSPMAVQKNTIFCGHGADLLVTVGIILIILRLQFYVTGITALRNQDPGKTNYSLNF